MSVNTLPNPYSFNWKEAYRFSEDDTPRLSNYIAPGSNTETPFIFESIGLSGGQSVYVAEYPFNGDWSNEQINNKPRTWTLQGFIRGPLYIKNRNELIDALTINSTDEEPGYLSLPTWGRIPVVVLDWNIDESGDQKGQCKLSVTFSRAGISNAERFDPVYTVTTADTVEALAARVIEVKSDAINAAKDDTIIRTAFSKIKDNLRDIVGKVNAAESTLNTITNSVSQITNLLAQGVTAPRDLLLATMAAITSIATSILEVSNAIGTYETITNPFTGDNAYKALISFLSNDDFVLNTEVLTVAEQNTKMESEQAFKAASLVGAASLLVQLPQDTTFEQYEKLLALYEKLEASVNQEDTSIFTAIRDVRVSLTQTIRNKTPDKELSYFASLPLPLLLIAHELGVDDDRLRDLNSIADSFVVEGTVIYVK